MATKKAMTKGVVYTVSDHPRYTGQLMTSIESLRRVHPDMPVTVFTDAGLDIDARVVSVSFSEEIFRDRIELLSRSPYDRNLYIDADFLVLSDISPLFRLLGRFHLAVAHADMRDFSPAPGVPASFPEVAGGTIVYRKCPETRAFFETWLEKFDRHAEEYPGYFTPKHGMHYHRDQASMRMALWEQGDLNLGILPPEWACHNYIGYMSSPVVMAQQARGRNTVEEADEFLNSAPNRPRVYMLDRMLIRWRGSDIEEVRG